MSINIIVAVDKNFGIGNNNKLPWKINEEIQIFKQKTINKVCVVGRKTYEYLPKLKDRILILLSSTRPLLTIDAILEKYSEIFVIGGAKTYEYVIKNYKHKIDKIHISIINNEYECDTYLDKSLLKDFYIVSKEQYEHFNHYEMVYKKYGEYQYLDLLKNVLNNGEKRIGRNGSIISDFYKSLKFDLRDGFPLLTTKKMFLKGIVEELLFFLKGDTQSKKLEEKGINIWKGNTTREFLDTNGFKDRKEGEMGPMYGAQWRHFNAVYNNTDGEIEPIEKWVVSDYMKEFHNISKKNFYNPELPEFNIDQLKYIVHEIKNNPTSRRILMTTFNPAQVYQGVLWPCHSITIQFYVQDCYLDMFCYNRSSDLFLGLPFNIASSSLLLMIIAKITNLEPRYFNLTLGDVHIYSEHEEQVKEQINRLPYIFPQINLPNINNLEDINKLEYTDFEIKNYFSYSSIKANMIA